MLEEAVELIRRLWEGDPVTHRGRYYTVEGARIYDPPPEPVPVIVAAYGTMAAGVAARVGDGLIAAMDEAVAAGVDHVYLHQIGPDQAGFLRFWTDEVAPEVRRHATR